MKRLLDSARQLLWKNPLLLHAFQRGNAYSSLGLWIVALLLGVYTFCTWLRVRAYSIAARFANSLPESMRDEEYKVLGLNQLGEISDGSLPTLVEMASCVAQLVILLLLIVGILLAILFHPHERKKKWYHPFSDEMRLLPLSRRQVLFAADVPYYFYSAAYWFCLLQMLLPTRQPYTGFPVEYLDELPLHADYLALTCGFILWAHIHAIFRTLQLPVRYRRFRKEVIRIWFVWFLIITLGTYSIGLILFDGFPHRHQVATSVQLGGIIAGTIWLLFHSIRARRNLLHLDLEAYPVARPAKSA